MAHVKRLLQVRLSHYIDNIMPTSPKTTTKFSGNVGNSKVTAKVYAALGLKQPKWFAAEEYEKPQGSTSASLWMSHAGGSCVLMVVGMLTWIVLVHLTINA